MKQLSKAIAEFSKKREWEKYHTPKNLAMALSVEVSELLEHFQWATPEESMNPSDEKMAEIRDEIGDVMIYLVHLADKLGIDPLQAAKDKLVKAAAKYPEEASKTKTWYQSKE